MYISFHRISVERGSEREEETKVGKVHIVRQKKNSLDVFIREGIMRRLVPHRTLSLVSFRLSSFPVYVRRRKVIAFHIIVKVSCVVTERVECQVVVVVWLYSFVFDHVM